jgi:hypothetical protein
MIMLRWCPIGLSRAVALAATLSLASAAFSWKPTTHIALAQIVVDELIQRGDGRLAIYVLDNFPDSAEKATLLGTYRVDPLVFAAVTQYPSRYRAGVIGPDGYPDILTGQQVAHTDSNNRGGSDAWLSYLYKQSRAGSYDQTTRLKIVSFVTGYLTHAAGDMFAHSFVNAYTGGDFNLGINAAKHFVIEGYCDRRAPGVERVLRMPVSIEGVEQFIYDTMIGAKPGSYLDKVLLQNFEHSKFSIPRIYSDIRNALQANINWYYSLPVRDQWLYSISHPGWITYQEFWVRDIDEGLRALPEVSHEIALALFFSPDRKVNLDRAKAIAAAYVRDHLLSMSGVPDLIGVALFIADFLNGLLPQVVREAIELMRDGLLTYLVNKAFGIALDELKRWLSDPENVWAEIVGPGSPPGEPGQGIRISLNDFNRTVMKIQGRKNEVFDYRKFAPAWNTVQMTKLLMLDAGELQRLQRDLGVRQGIAAPINAMLGYNKKLDGSCQWNINPAKMFLVPNGMYHALFLRQTGDCP